MGQAGATGAHRQHHDPQDGSSQQTPPIPRGEDSRGGGGMLAGVRRERIRRRRAGRRTTRPPSSGMQNETRVPPPEPGRSTGCRRGGSRAGATDAARRRRRPSPCGAWPRRWRTAARRSARRHRGPVPSPWSVTEMTIPCVHDARTHLDRPILGGVAAGVVQELVDRRRGSWPRRRARAGSRDPRASIGIDGCACPTSATALSISGARSVYSSRSSNVPRSSSVIVDDLVDEPDQLVQRRLQLPRNSLALLVAHARVLQHVGDALGDGHGRPELVGDVRQELGLRGGALRRRVSMSRELLLELADSRECGSERRSPSSVAALRVSSDRRRSRPHGSRAAASSTAVVLQQVAGGAAREHQRHRGRGVADGAVHPTIAESGAASRSRRTSSTSLSPSSRARSRPRRAAAPRPSR